MVRLMHALPVAVLLGSSGPALAQSSISWREAGGALFAGAETSSSQGEVQPAVDPFRLPPLAQPFAQAVAAAAERHGLDPKLLHAVVAVESAYRVRVCSTAGACGLTQLMPGTAAELGVVDRFDPADNLAGGANYLARQLHRFGDVRLALAAYNAGPERVARLGRIPNIAETRAYVVAVIDCYLALTAGRGVRSSRDCTPGEGGL